MLLELMLQDERKEGRAEGRAEGKAEGRIEGRAEGKAEEVISFLEDLAPVSEELKKIIMAEQDLNILKRWLKLSAKVKSIDQFKAEM